VHKLVVHPKASFGCRGRAVAAVPPDSTFERLDDAKRPAAMLGSGAVTGTLDLPLAARERGNHGRVLHVSQRVRPRLAPNTANARMTWSGRTPATSLARPSADNSTRPRFASSRRTRLTTRRLQPRAIRSTLTLWVPDTRSVRANRLIGTYTERVAKPAAARNSSLAPFKRPASR
jgi:hypothetical protein